ncbi:DsbA family protein [Hyphomicrobium sp.]|uniref:DsbA family protein n=1 Tax=Hyphomicrobium sp. TaxID=82 RepID=UPI002B899448|nr:DsbA family protein [Hyphomicrobium sp.]HRN89246.1 DsbA family protein [Hyphomicrobium sp.]HRQ27834.1 DsbA family protein [Hyphomicrobium sp.]
MRETPATAVRASVPLLALAATLALAACSGNSSSLSNLATAEGGSSSSAFPGTSENSRSASSSVPAFGDIPDGTSGGRQVIENPTNADIMATGTLPEMSLGNPDAPVTIIKYASLTCPHCRVFHRDVFPELKRTYIDTGKVRFILREFPIGLQSGTATVAWRCAPADKYFELYGKFLEQQARWVSQEVRRDPIFDVAKQVGMTRRQFDACYENQAMIDGLKWVKDRGRQLGIIGTPNFFVAGKLVKETLTMSGIRERIDPLLSSGQRSAAAQQ